jgi:hypothetical protein
LHEIDSCISAAFVFGITIYITVTLPGLERVVLKPENETEVFEKAEALRVMCAGNVLIAICLVGVLALQVGNLRYYVGSRIDPPSRLDRSTRGDWKPKNSRNSWSKRRKKRLSKRQRRNE